MKKEIRNFLKITFDTFDENRSGSIDLKEFRKVIKIMGVRMSKEDVK